jgi:hypothetical protein
VAEATITRPPAHPPAWSAAPSRTKAAAFWSAAVALASLAATPLLRGGFWPFTQAGIAATVAAAAGTLALADSTAPRGVFTEPATRSRARIWLRRLALAAFFLGVAQLLPLPASLGSRLAPGAATLDHSLGATIGYAPLSRDPAATREALVALLVALSLVTVTHVVATRAGARRLLYVAVIAGAVGVGAIGIAETFLGRPLLRVGLPPHARPFGPFANRNHASALLLLALPCAIGLARDLEREGRRALGGALQIVAGALLLALVLNGSRGGLLAAVVLIGVVAWRARGPVKWRVGIGLAVAAAVAIPGAAWARRHELTTVSERVTLARDALRMSLDAPLTGIGLGAFGAAYPPYQTVPRDLRFRHAESEPIELLVEGGAPLLLIGLAAAATIGVVCFRVLLRRKVAWADAGAALGALTVLAHACCDFPLRVPGVSVPLLLVVGSLLAVSPAPPPQQPVEPEP